MLQLHALGVLFQNFKSAVLGEVAGQMTGTTVNKVQSVIINKKLENDFSKCGNIASHFDDNKGLDEFGQAVLAVFSKENLLELYRKLKKEKGYDYRVFLESELRKICAQYEVEADNFIELFIDLFLDCIYQADKTLYYEIYQGDSRREARQNFDISHKNEEITIALLKDIRDGIGNNPKQSLNEMTTGSFTQADEGDSGNCGANSVTNESDSHLDNVGKTKDWELTYPHCEDVFWNNETKMQLAMKQLTSHWKKERELVPKWFIIPYNKRALLRSYTPHEELLYFSKKSAAMDKFEFAFEIIWRYERSFSSYDNNFVKAIEDVFGRFDDKVLPDVPEKDRPIFYNHWFCVGLFLLREYREEIVVDKWNSVYAVLRNKMEFYPDADARLSLEYIKLLFMQMKISDTCTRISLFRCNPRSYEMRLQIAGIRAECGQFEQAFTDLRNLETDLLVVLQQEGCDQIYIGSILSVIYFLQAFIYGAKKPFHKDEEIQSIWSKQEQFERFFDFDYERLKFVREFSNSLKKENEDEPFGIGREKRTIVYGGHQYKEVYDFYRLLEQMGSPLHIGYTRLLDDDERDFLRILLEHFRYIGWNVLLRMGGTKTAELVLTRKEFIRLSQIKDGRLKSAFTYVYDALDRDIDAVHGSPEKHIGDAYSHILSTGLCILQRLASMADKEQQKKLIAIMCKLMDADVLDDSRAFNKWIAYVMSITDEHVKAECLNEMLHSSFKERHHLTHEIDLDPFDVFHSYVLAKTVYGNAYIAPKAIEEMLEAASKSEAEKKHIIPRLEQLYYFGLLSDEYCDRFSDLLWGNIEGDEMPLGNGYYPDFFLKCPHPEQIDVEGMVRKRLLNPEKFKTVRERRLSSMNFGDFQLWDEIRHLNQYRKDFWSEEEVGQFMAEFLEYWDVSNKTYGDTVNPGFYESEFEARTKGFIRTIISFDRSQILKLPPALLDKLWHMAEEIGEIGIAHMQLLIFITQDDELVSLEDKLIRGLRSPVREIAEDAVGASEQLLLSGCLSPVVQRILHEILILCLYRKAPGLRLCLNALHNVLYQNPERDFPERDMDLMREALHTLAVQTEYQADLWTTEKETKRNILTRYCCAGLAFQIYLYENRKNLEHSDAVLEWKDICTGEKSLTEFSEVRRCWLE